MEPLDTQNVDTIPEGIDAHTYQAIKDSVKPNLDSMTLEEAEKETARLESHQQALEDSVKVAEHFRLLAQRKAESMREALQNAAEDDEGKGATLDDLNASGRRTIPSQLGKRGREGDDDDLERGGEGGRGVSKRR
jgi:hypothetical protein